MYYVFNVVLLLESCFFVTLFDIFAIQICFFLLVQLVNLPVVVLTLAKCSKETMYQVIATGALLSTETF